MNDLLRRSTNRLTVPRLIKALSGEPMPSEALETSTPMGPIRDAIASIDAGLAGPDLDLGLVEPLHRAMSTLSRGEAADMRVWHWMTASEFPEFVWRRWRSGGAPEVSELDGALTAAMFRRFAGASSLVGVSRNTFARLWWVAEHLEGDYEAARFALSKQDMFQAVFERLFGIYGPASLAALRNFRGKSEGEIRSRARWLNVAAGTTLLEALSQSEIEALLDESSTISAST